jgi:hypothetical protein
MMNSWIGRAKQGWKRTERFRAGVQAGLKTGTLVAESVRAIASAPFPEQPQVTRTEKTPIARKVEPDGARQLKDYGTVEVNRLVAEQRRVVDDLPRRAAADRTARAVGTERTRGGGRQTPGRGR